MPKASKRFNAKICPKPSCILEWNAIPRRSDCDSYLQAEKTINLLRIVKVKYADIDLPAFP